MSQITNLLGSGSGVVFQVTADVGVAIPSAGNINLNGDGVTTRTTAAGDTVVISLLGVTVLHYTNVTTTPYVVLVTDDYISVDTSALAITIRLPNAATLGKTFAIKDRTGSAATRNITVTTVGGVVLIEGATTFVMNTNSESIQVIGNGTAYEIY